MKVEDCGTTVQITLKYKEAELLLLLLHNAGLPEDESPDGKRVYNTLYEKLDEYIES